MAERSQLKITDRDQIADDDPFAELTRIMGFDPRVSVKQDTAQPQADSAEDFEIDLERELMGEFGASEEAAAVDAVSPDPLYSVEDEFEADETARIDNDIAASLDQDFQFEDDVLFDEAEPALEASPVFEQDTPVAESRPVEVEVQPASHHHEEHVDEADIVFDDIDFGLTESVEKEPESNRAVAEGDLDADFDKAMADVDMNFEADPTHLEAESAQEFKVLQPEAPPAAEQGEAYQQDEESLEASSYREPDDVVPSVVETVSTQSSSLEDELNALLNQMSARPLAAQAHDEVLPADKLTADDVNWSLDETPAAAEQIAPDYQASNDLEADFAEELVAEPYSELAEGHSEDTLAVDFDHDDLDAALTAELDDRSVEEEELAASEQPAAAPHDPIEALQWLAAKPVMDAAASSHSWSRGTPYIQNQQPTAAAFTANPPPEAEPFVASQPSYDAPESYEVAFDGAELAAELQEEAEAAAVDPVATAPVYDEVPDIETIDVPDRVVALADDLDIPEVPFGGEDAEKPIYDDLEAEFTTLLTEMNTGDEPSAAPKSAAYEDDTYGQAYVAGAGVGAAAAAYAGAQRGAPTANADYAASTQFDIDDLPGSRPLTDRHAVSDDDLAFDPDLDEEMSLPEAPEAASAHQPRNRTMMVAALVGAVALIGGIGAFALSFGGGDGTGAPVLVKADDSPIKVKPENPGGTVIPNQDNKVYDMVANGAKPAAPTQEKLVTDAEEPVDVAAQVPEVRVVEPTPNEANAEAAQPTGKSEERIMPAEVQQEVDGQSDVALVTPRKVRTMIVKPDGSLVPREEPQPAALQVTATEPVDPAPQLVGNPAADDQTGAVAPASESPQPSTAEAAPVAATQPQAQQPAQSGVTPALAPVAPQRPAEQPVDIVGEVKPDQVAAINTAAGSATGAWSMQIASQPSVESAQSTYQDLARRYANVLEGRSVNIVKAEVAGKGTFYRVRVAANSRNEAITLCESYKAAGGNCFVSK